MPAEDAPSWQWTAYFDAELSTAAEDLAGLRDPESVRLRRYLYNFRKAVRANRRRR